MTNNDLQNITQKTNDRVTRIPLQTEGELWCSGGMDSSCFRSGIHRISLVTNTVLSGMQKGHRSL